MRKKMLLIIFCFICTYIQAQGFEITEPKVQAPSGLKTFTNLLLYQQVEPTNQTNTSTTTQQKEADWYITIATTKDSKKRIKVKYQLTSLNEVCIMCSAYIYYNNQWRKTFIYKDEDGYFVLYYDEYYF